MSIDWAASRLHIVVSASQRLADEWCQGVLAAWDGPVAQHREPPRLAEIVLGLDTPSLFEPAALVVIRCSEEYLAKQRAVLLQQLGMPLAGGALLMLVDRLAARDTLSKAAKAAAALHAVDVPQRDGDVRSWLVARLHALPEGVAQPPLVAQELMSHRGTQVDALLAAIDQALDHADGQLTVDDVQAAVGGSSDHPTWDATGALFEGRLRDALAHVYAGRGLEAEQILAGMANELRRMLCSLASDDDRTVANWAGMANPNQVRFARRRARQLRQRACERLLRGVLQTQRACRHGDDPELAVELLMLNAQRVIRP